MVNLTNIINALKPYFTLKSDLNKKWLTYLKEDRLGYINGGVYLLDSPINYHIQKNPDVAFEAKNGFTECKLFFKGDVVEEQMRDCEAFLDNERISCIGSVKVQGGKNYASILISNDLYDIEEKNVYDLRINVPPFNKYNNCYQGVEGFEKRWIPQIMEWSVEPYVSNGKVKCTVSILDDGVTGQEIKAYTTLRNGNLSNSQSVSLTTQSTVSFEVTKGSQDVKFVVELRPIIFSNQVVYTGYYLEVDL